MAGRAEARRRAEEMIKILSRGPERWRYIRKLVIEPRVGVNSAIVQILSLARNYIVELEIVKSRDHIYRSQWSPRKGETIWAKLADFGPFETYTFPNLKSISVQLEDYDCVNVVGHIIQRAPGTLHIKLEGGDTNYFGHEENEDGEDCDCMLWSNHQAPNLAPNCKVADISCPAHEGCGTPPLVVSELLRLSPLTSLKIRLDGAGTENGTGWLDTILMDEAIAHLEYDIPNIPFSEAVEETGLVDNYAIRSLIITLPDISAAHERLQVS
jgi:hypothetical protein